MTKTKSQLEMKLKECDFALSALQSGQNDERAGVLSDKGNAYSELYKLTKDSKYLTPAIACYDEAIEILHSPYDYTKRSKLYAASGQEDKAAEGIIKAQEAVKQIQATGGSVDITDIAFVSYTAQMLEENKKIKEKIKSLKDKVIPELGEVLESQNNQISNLIVRDGIKEQRLDSNDRRFESHEQEMRERLESHEQQMQEMRERLDELAANDRTREEQLRMKGELLAKYTLQISSIEEDIRKLKDSIEPKIQFIEENVTSLQCDSAVSKQDMLSKISQLRNIITTSSTLDKDLLCKLNEDLKDVVRDLSTKTLVISNLETKLTNVCSVVDNHETRLKMIESDIKDGGVDDKALVARGFKEMESKDPALFAYCKTFYWTALNLIGAYKELSTGVVQGNADHTTAESALAKGARVAAGFAVDIVKGVPFIGGIVTACDTIISGIYGTVVENKLNNRAKAITEVVQSKLCMVDDISVTVAKLAIAMTNSKAVEIKSVTVQSQEKSSPATVWFKAKFAQIKETILPSVELHDSQETQLALQDVTLMMTYFAKYHDNIVKPNAGTLDEQLQVAVNDRGFTKLIDNGYAAAHAKTKQSCSCTMLFIESVIYANPAVEMLKTQSGIQLAQKLGMSVNSLLNLGESYLHQHELFAEYVLALGVTNDATAA